MGPSVHDNRGQSPSTVGPGLDRLPEDLFRAVLERLDEDGLKTLRCLNKAFETILTPRLFSTVLFAQRLPVLNAFHEIAKYPHLCKHVKTIVMNDAKLVTNLRSDLRFEPSWLALGGAWMGSSGSVERILSAGLIAMKNVDTIIFSSSGIKRVSGEDGQIFVPPRDRRDAAQQSRRNMLVALARAMEDLEDERIPILQLLADDAIQHFKYNLMWTDLIKVGMLFRRLNRLDLPLHIPMDEVQIMLNLLEAGKPRRVGPTIRAILQHSSQELRALTLRVNMPSAGTKYDWVRDPQGFGSITSHSTYILVSSLRSCRDSLLDRFVHDAEWPHMSYLELGNLPLYEEDLNQFVVSHAKTLKSLILSHVCLFRGSWRSFLERALKTGTLMEQLRVEDCLDYTGKGNGEKARTFWCADMKMVTERRRIIMGCYGLESTPFVVRLEEETS